MVTPGMLSGVFLHMSKNGETIKRETGVPGGLKELLGYQSRSTKNTKLDHMIILVVRIISH